MRITAVDLMVPAAVADDSATIADARQALLRHGASEVFVVDANGKLLGIVPDYDFLKAELSAVPASDPVSGLISTRIETVDAKDDVATLLPKLREAWCGRIAVLQGSRFVGQVRRCDMLRLIVQLQQVAAMTEVAAEQQILSGPHFAKKRKHRPALQTLAKQPSRRVRRLRAS